MKNKKKKYKTTRVERIILDKDISIQMQSKPPGDPVIRKNNDNGGFNPYK